MNDCLFSYELALHFSASHRCSDRSAEHSGYGCCDSSGARRLRVLGPCSSVVGNRCLANGRLGRVLVDVAGAVAVPQGARLLMDVSRWLGPYGVASQRGDGLAIFSPNYAYRYFLERPVDEMFGEGVVTFIMLNPSTADAFKNDPTVARCVSFAKQRNARSLRVTNLSPLRATDPRDMLRAGPEPDIVKECNLWYIRKATEDARIVIVAWGNHGKAEGRAEYVRAALAGVSLRHLGLTKHGQPRHPLYVAGSTDLTAL